LVWLPLYWNRADFNLAAEGGILTPDEIASISYLRSHTRPDDVVLASDSVAMRIVGPAGRKTVALDRYLSSPYVAVGQRRNDRDTMLRQLQSGNAGGFRSLALAYGVVSIVTTDRDTCRVAARMLGPVERFGPVCVWIALRAS